MAVLISTSLPSSLAQTGVAWGRPSGIRVTSDTTIGPSNSSLWEWGIVAAIRVFSLTVDDTGSSGARQHNFSSADHRQVDHLTVEDEGTGSCFLMGMVCINQALRPFDVFRGGGKHPPDDLGLPGMNRQFAGEAHVQGLFTFGLLSA